VLREVGGPGQARLRPRACCVSGAGGLAASAALISAAAGVARGVVGRRHRVAVEPAAAGDLCHAGHRERKVDSAEAMIGAQPACRSKPHMTRLAGQCARSDFEIRIIATAPTISPRALRLRRLLLRRQAAWSPPRSHLDGSLTRCARRSGGLTARAIDLPLPVSRAAPAGTVPPARSRILGALPGILAR